MFDGLCRCMRFYFDLNRGKLVTGIGFANPLGRIDFKRGDSAEVVLGFYRGVSEVVLSDNAMLNFVLKEKGKYDGDPIVSADTWFYDVDRGGYVCNPDFNTIELNALLGSGDGGFDDDLEFVDTMLEITWSVDGGDTWSSTQTVEARIHNDVIKGNEGVPVTGSPTFPTAGSLYNLTDNITVTQPVDLDALGSGHVIMEEGAGVEARSNLNFVGAAVSITDDVENDSTVVNVDGGFQVYTSDTTPLHPEEGDIWFNTSVGSAYVYYVDQDSGQWVGISPAGPVGPAGPEGPAGADGVDGVNGVDGADGANGVDGVNGTDGVDGAGVEVVGSVADSSELDPQYSGSVGDMFIAQDTGNGHVWDGAFWDDVGTIRGPIGLTGPTGPQGLTGPVGPQGQTGPEGSTGPQGLTGPVGPQGQTGPEGPTGAQGLTGPVGPEGQLGPQGPQGLVGPQGVTGPAGVDGADGGFNYTLEGTILTITNDTTAVYTVTGTELTITT